MLTKIWHINKQTFNQDTFYLVTDLVNKMPIHNVVQYFSVNYRHFSRQHQWSWHDQARPSPPPDTLRGNFIQDSISATRNLTWKYDTINCWQFQTVIRAFGEWCNKVAVTDPGSNILVDCNLECSYCLSAEWSSQQLGLFTCLLRVKEKNTPNCIVMNKVTYYSNQSYAFLE